MFDAHFILLHVDSPAESARFYAGLLGREPLEQSPTFAMFALPSGVRLGLWSRHTVEPAATPSGGAAEVAMMVPDVEAVDAVWANWRQRGIAMLQEPTDLDFGRTFTARDPDGHRLRVFHPFAPGA